MALADGFRLMLQESRRREEARVAQMTDLTDKRPKAPNLRTVEMPRCCWNCKNFVEHGADYDDSSETCRKFRPEPFAIFGIDSLCDGWEQRDG